MKKIELELDQETYDKIQQLLTIITYFIKFPIDKNKQY
jgi:hypothetical protein